MHEDGNRSSETLKGLLWVPLAVGVVDSVVGGVIDGVGAGSATQAGLPDTTEVTIGD
jgi:hypothetical protein